MSRTEHLRAFAAFGIELEYMIVDRQTLAVRPICDQVLRDAAVGATGTMAAGEAAMQSGELAVGDYLEWSNELVAHVIELKTAAPTADLKNLAAAFQDGVARVNAVLARHGAMLMPTAMHPTMQPSREMHLYPHGDGKEIYEAYHRIFDCRGHGWSNLQSVHINLPFFDDAEFARLHAAVRLALPVLPALAASSPVYEGRVSGLADSRLSFYRQNQRRVPEISGQVIPERAFSREAYQRLILDKVYRAIAPYDPSGELQYEWLNSRGAIARFDRHAIEIRVLDLQESPTMDAAMIALVVSLVRALYDEVWLEMPAQQAFDEAALLPIFVACLERGERAVIDAPDYLRALGWAGGATTGGELWRHLAAKLRGMPQYPAIYHDGAISALIEHGSLATRILTALGPHPDAGRIDAVYRRLCEVLVAGGSFRP